MACSKARMAEAERHHTVNYREFRPPEGRKWTLAFPYMESVPTATESIEDFFARYTGYLTTGDIEALAATYHYPALAVTALGCLAITDPQQSRDFFGQGQQFYRRQGIQGVRARDIVTDVEVPGIWIGRLVLENLDESGAPVGVEHNAYQVVTIEDGTRRIAVSTPLDAYS